VAFLFSPTTETKMKPVIGLRAMTVVVVAAMSMHVFAQGSDPVGAPSSDSGAATKVESKAQVKQQRSADRALQKKIRGALARTKGLDVTNVTVRARSGAVILEGTVPEQAQITRAGQVTQGIPGVKTLKNDLGVRPKGP
jgi:hyperosmotically inducible periplasmic protein